MSFIDMAQHKKGNYIVYRRQKTAHAINSKLMQVAVRPEIQELLD